MTSDTNQPLLKLMVSSYYPNQFAEPTGCKLVVTLLTTSNGITKRQPIGEFPIDQTELILTDAPTKTDGDTVLEIAVAYTLLRKQTDANKSAVATIKERLRTLNRWATRNDLETDFAALSELVRLENLVANVARKDWLSATTVGHDPVSNATSGWTLTIAGEKRKKATVRWFAPSNNVDTKRPLVIALHGAGGSENMFFDGYGDGKIVRMCEKRSWFLVSPGIRVGGVGMALPDLVEQLATQFPIDMDSVFVVGHSMGAGYATRAVLDSVSRDDEFRYRAVAALGGGGRANSMAAAKTPDFFVAAGSHDFGRQGAEKLFEALKAHSIPSQYREYPNAEHLGIVQVALVDVFEFFDSKLGR